MVVFLQQLTPDKIQSSLLLFTIFQFEQKKSPISGYWMNVFYLY